jgi:hypothetical protein
MTQKTFKEAYGTLQQHAQTLRDQRKRPATPPLNGLA